MKPTSRHPAAAARFLCGILAGFALTGVLFFALLTLWSVLAGPFVHLQSASFVIASALVAAGVLGVSLYRRFNPWRDPPRAA